MHEGSPRVLISPEEKEQIKDVMSQINIQKSNLIDSLKDSVKFNEADKMINAKDYIDRIKGLCTKNEYRDEFGNHLSEIAETYDELLKNLPLFSSDTLKKQLGIIEDGRAAVGLRGFFKENDIELK